VEAGYSQSIANIMTTAAAHTGLKATFDEKAQEVLMSSKDLSTKSLCPYPLAMKGYF
jgi:hypothetical protein